MNFALFSVIGSTRNVDRYVVEVDEGDLEAVVEKAEKFGYYPKRRILEKYYVFEKKVTATKNVDEEEVITELQRNPKNGDVDPSMNVPGAWSWGYTGKGVVVAIVDDGVEATHPDLKNSNTASGYDYIDEDDDPSPTYLQYEYFSHGTNCAGLVAAERDNDNCVVGVAYDATIIGVRLIGEGITDSTEAMALVHQLDQVDIYSNSWGPLDGEGLEGPSEVTADALAHAVEHGRGGRGAIYVWAAGNGAIEDNCNADGYANSIFTIAITSLGHDGEPAYYSEVCAPALAVTYGGGGGDYLISTDAEMKCSGKELQGTSFSAPLAAGIIALALEANPELTWRDVQHLIVRTSKPHTTTDNIFGWATNGAGLQVSQRLGFGLMNAEAMVTQAIDWATVPPQVLCSKQVTVEKGISFFSDSSSTVSVSDCAVVAIEHVQVRLMFETTSVGSLQVTLKSPHGTTSYLLSQSSSKQKLNSYTVWDLMSVHFWGEHPQGEWTLFATVKDFYPTGTIYGWELTIYGTETDPFDCGCNQDELECDQCVCIPDSWQCDGWPDCYDFADEENCGYCICDVGEFQCDGCYCITAEHVCNGFAECLDFTDEKDCDCKPPPMPETMIGVVDTLSQGGTATYECKPGYVGLGDPTMKCETYGAWSCLELRCTALDCGFPMNRVGMSPSWTGTSFGHTGQYKCDAGFKSTGDGSILCQAIGEWSDSSLECHYCGCSDFELACSDCTCILEAWRCDFMADCSDGADEEDCGTGCLACEDDEFSCDECYCIPNRWICDNLADCYDRTDEENCDCECGEDEFTCGNCDCIMDIWECDGYYDCPDDTDELNCGCSCDDDEFTCGNCDCIPFYWMCDGWFDCEDETDEESCKCECDDDQFTCDACNCINDDLVCDWWEDCQDGMDEKNCDCECSSNEFSCGDCICIPLEWRCDNFNDCSISNADEENCALNVCGLPESFDGMVYEISVFGFTATYVCNTGYEGTGNGTVVCEGDKWTSPTLACEIVDCGTPEEMDGMTRMFENTTYGSIVTYVCDTTNSAPANATVTCEADRLWSCLRLKCPSLTPPGPSEDDSTVSCVNPIVPEHADFEPVSTTVGSKAIYTCSDGFTLVGTAEVVCKPDGQWSDAEFVCQSGSSEGDSTVSCVNPTVPEHADFEPVSTTVGSKAIYSCSDGFTLVGSAEVVCKPDGQWSDAEFVCQSLGPGSTDTCGEPLIQDNAIAVVSDKTVGSVCTYVCGVGFTMDGDADIICKADGKWSEVDFTCKQNSEANGIHYSQLAFYFCTLTTHFMIYLIL
ncbi:hypothetical protein ScPMuIL_014286 [Solemya velum]